MSSSIDAWSAADYIRRNSPDVESLQRTAVRMYQLADAARADGRTDAAMRLEDAAAMFLRSAEQQ